jgi:starch synthase
VQDPTHNNLTKLAVEYADGVILGPEKVSDELVAYINASRTASIECADEDRMVNDATAFYESVLQGNPALVEE